MGGLEGRLNALIEARAQGQRAESTSGRSGSLPPFRLSSEAELSAAGSWQGMAWTAGALSPEISPPKARSCARPP